MSEILSLETLPSVIQDSIFQYLQTPDLLRLCSLSENLYWAATSQLYKSITVVTKYDSEVLRGHRENWKANYGTFLGHRTFEKLVDTLIVKPELGELVRKLTFHRTVCFNRYALHTFLAHTPHLREFHNFSRFQIPQATVEKLQRVTCVLGQSLKHAKCLRELRIRDFDDNVSEISQDGTSEDYFTENRLVSVDNSPRIRDADSYKSLARDLVESGAYANLRKLHISSAQVVGRADILGQYYSEDYSGNWFGFFEQLRSLKIKLHLEALAIHGVALGRAEDVAKWIGDSVRLRKLKMLVLVHDDCDTHVPDHSFLQLLTKNTPRLESLAVFFTREYGTTEVESLVEVLKHNIPHQLKDLSIIMRENDPLRARYSIQQCISETQKNLIRVRIDDGRPLVADPVTFAPSMSLQDIDEKLDEINESNYEVWSSVYNREYYSPDVIAGVHSGPTISDLHLDAIEKGLKEVGKYMRHDIFYKDAQEKLPHLKQYFVGGLHFDMEKRGIFINDVTVALETKTRKRPAFVDLDLTEANTEESRKRSRQGAS